MRATLTPFVCLLAATMSCGGTTAHDGGGGADAGGTPSRGGSSGTAGRSGGGTSGSGQGGGTSSSCPAVEPKDGTPCKVPSSDHSLPGSSDADCSWGADIRPLCRTTGICQQGVWSIRNPPPGCDDPPLPQGCPPTEPTVGTACSPARLLCSYDDGTVCFCSPCEGGADYPICRTIDPPLWACSTPPAGCPNPPAQAGSACNQDGLQCGTSCELPITCKGGAWQWGARACPICAAPDTPIATPLGERPIAELRVGDLVYSVDDGATVAVPIAQVGSTPVANHHVLRLELEGGGILEISPGHPMADGRPLSALVAGQKLDAQHAVLSIDLVRYPYDRTYDILPSSSTGTYFANGALLGSTLRASH